MTSRRTTRRSGFSLLEVIVVLAVMGILLGAAAPLVNLAADQQRRAEVRSELGQLSDALQAYYFDNGSFPATIDAADFFGVYVVPGVQDTAIRDGWGLAQNYLYVVTTSPDVATVRSIGPNVTDEGGSGDDIEARIPGTVPGNERTRARMRVIVEVLANFLESGGTLTGTWSTDRTNMGLGATYEVDGFGTAFQLDPATYVLQSAGPDRSHGTSDDLST